MSEYDEKAFREACHAYGFAVHDSTPAEMIHIVMSFPTNKIIEGQRDQLATLRDTVARLEGELAEWKAFSESAQRGRVQCATLLGEEQVAKKRLEGENARLRESMRGAMNKLRDDGPPHGPCPAKCPAPLLSWQVRAHVPKADGS